MPTDFEFKASPCVRSGLCCQVGPCPFGTWDATRHQCAFLEIDEEGDGWKTYKCGKYEEITSLPPEHGASFAPAFGAGCCMSLFNVNRAAILRDLSGKARAGAAGHHGEGDAADPER